MAEVAPRIAATLEWIRPPGQKRSPFGLEVILGAAVALAGPGVVEGAA